MNFFKIREDAIIPTRATEDSAGYDVYANATITIPPKGIAIIPTGVGYENLPKNYVGIQAIRSGSAWKRSVMLLNGIGVLDSDYPEEIGVMLWNRTDNVTVTIDKGERIAQIVFVKYETLKGEEPPTTKRESGFGSTGTK